MVCMFSATRTLLRYNLLGTASTLITQRRSLALAMSEELFDILDPQTGTKIGVKPRKEVHRDGDWHRSCHMWIVNKKGELIIQLRSPEKDSWGNCWDISSAGHLSAGQESKEAAVRELEEEIGVKAEESQLKFLFTTKKQVVLKDGAFVDNEMQDVYILQRDDLAISNLKFQDGEVVDAQWIHWEDLLERQRNNDPSLVPVSLESDRYGQFFKHMEDNYPKKS